MYTKITAALLTFAMIATASKTAQQVQEQQCGNTGKLSCCNTEQDPAAAGGLLAAAGLDSLLGGSCQQIPINVIALPISNNGDVCGGNQVACCQDTSTNQVGLINLSTTCTPINVLG